MYNENRVKGKTALITGASSGIGRSCAIALAKLGMNIIIVARRNDLLLDLKKIIEQEYLVKVLALQLDVRNDNEVKEKLSKLPVEWKDIDILINNAGLASGLDKLYNNSSEDISTVIDTNIKGLLYVTNALLPHMIERDIPATIINMGSVAGDAAYAGGAFIVQVKLL